MKHIVAWLPHPVTALLQCVAYNNVTSCMVTFRNSLKICPYDSYMNGAEHHWAHEATHAACILGVK